MAKDNFKIVVSAGLNSKKAQETIQKELDKIKGNVTININQTNIKQAKEKVKELGDELKKASDKGQTLGDKISKYVEWNMIAKGIEGVKSAMSDMVSVVVDLDKSLTELSKVTDLTDAGLKNLADQAFEVGENVARTGIEVIDATTAFSKAGYKEQALELAEVSLQYMNIADEAISVDDSVSILIATMKAFNIEASDSTQIIDKLNEVECVPLLVVTLRTKLA